MTDEARKKWLHDLFKELNYKTFLVPLLGHCYNRVKEETMKMREAILKSLGLEANDKEVAVLYKGEKADNRPNTRFVELPEERPPWFTDNLLEPSNPNKDLK
ncbi:MRPL32 [Cordylochernes scorpioides]|uniref:MRPL32 n=1 Tax=Cordylochernes scorpioides TaxID=51811 RepID=A0ABY6KAP8_9ARAC|nr:MRPL32 [Cordylochernes scorpioides]